MRWKLGLAAAQMWIADRQAGGSRLTAEQEASLLRAIDDAILIDTMRRRGDCSVGAGVRLFFFVQQSDWGSDEFKRAFPITSDDQSEQAKC
jgi:hypothetical protein